MSSCSAPPRFGSDLSSFEPDFVQLQLVSCCADAVLLCLVFPELGFLQKHLLSCYEVSRRAFWNSLGMGISGHRRLVREANYYSNEEAGGEIHDREKIMQAASKGRLVPHKTHASSTCAVGTSGLL